MSQETDTDFLMIYRLLKVEFASDCLLSKTYMKILNIQLCSQRKSYLQLTYIHFYKVRVSSIMRNKYLKAYILQYQNERMRWVNVTRNLNFVDKFLYQHKSYRERLISKISVEMWIFRGRRLFRNLTFKSRYTHFSCRKMYI